MCVREKGQACHTLVHTLSLAAPTLISRSLTHSNFHPFSLLPQFAKWQQAMEDGNVPFPTVDDVERKLREVHDVMSSARTGEDILYTIESKRKCNCATTSISREIFHNQPPLQEGAALLSPSVSSRGRGSQQPGSPHPVHGCVQVPHLERAGSLPL